MEKTPFILALVIAVIVLVAFNQGFQKSNLHDGSEISSYDYAKLHAAIENHAEIAAIARQELTKEYVSVAQYNKIMHQVDLVRLKQARQMAAMRQSAAR